MPPPLKLPLLPVELLLAGPVPDAAGGPISPVFCPLLVVVPGKPYTVVCTL